MEDSIKFFTLTIPKFDDFYDHWTMLMETLLRSKEYWELVEHGVTVEPPNATHEQRKLADESRLKSNNYLF